MRLSTERERDDARSVTVLHAAFDAGVTLLDTADAYCWDAADVGHNERLIARALATWAGDRSRIRVATKGGLTRPDGRWAADGRAGHLLAACAASRRALGVERIHLYQLHAPDPRTPLATSVRALASLKRDGYVESIGLCNVNVSQIEEARNITEIAAVQVELSVWKDDSILSGVAEYCIANDIPCSHIARSADRSGGVGPLSDALLADSRQATTPHRSRSPSPGCMDLSALVVPVAGANTCGDRAVACPRNPASR